MKSLGSSKKILIILGFITLVFFVFYYLIFIDIKNKNEHTALLLEEISSKENKQDYALSLQKIIENTNSDITRVNKSIIQSDDNVTFIEQLESMAKGNGLSITIDSLVFEDSKLLASSSLTSLRVKAKTSGSFTGTYTFLAQIESLPLKIKVNKFGFTNTTDNFDVDSKKSSKSSIWQSVFDITILKYK